MSDEATGGKTDLKQIEYKTETPSNEGNLNIIEIIEQGGVTSSCSNSEIFNNDTEIKDTPELTEESSAKSMEDSDITGNDGMNECTETESCGAIGGYVASEEEFSNPCKPCLENDRNIDSLLYCVECEDYLCEKCVEMHRMVKPSRSHKLVPKDVLNNCGDELVINRKEECPIHMNEVVEWFCISDDKLCCNICKATEHNKCESIVAIASVAETTNMQSIEEKIEVNLPEQLKWKWNSSFETGEHCRGISFNSERLFVACGGDGEKEGPGHLKMFDMTGQVLKTIRNDLFGKAIFDFPCKIKFLPGGTTAIVQIKIVYAK